MTELSIRLRTLTRSRWTRLSSRSTCRKKLSPPRILSAVFGVVGRLLVRQHVAQRGVGREGKAADFVVDVADGAELAGEVHVGLDVDGLKPLRETAGLLGAVVFLNVLAGTGDGQQVEQLEVVEAEHVQETWRLALGVLQSEPAIELKLRLANRCLDAGNAVVVQRRVVRLGDEGDLVLEVGEAVVDRRGRKHEDAGLHALLDDAPHEAVVAGLAVIVRGLVAEVVGFVDDDEVVVAPVDVGEVDVAGSAAVAGQVGVVENVVIEAVGGEEVAAVVGLVECPVVAQALRHEHQHAVIAKLVVFDDGERLESLAEADAVGNDAAAQPFQLVDGPDDAVPLELVQLLPDSGVADAGGGFDDAFFVQFVAEVFEDVEESQIVDERRGFRIGEFLKTREESGFLLIGGWQRIPQAREPRAEDGGFLRFLGTLDQTELIAGSDPQTFSCESTVAGDDTMKL